MSLIDQLLELQETDCRIREMDHMKADIPARQEKEKTRLDEHRALLQQAEDDLKRKQAAIKELDVEGQSRREKILKLRTQQMELKTNKEFRAIEDEIATIADQIKGLEDRELVLMQEVEDARGKVADSRESLKRQEAAVQADIEIWNGKMREIGAELEVLQAKRRVQAAAVDPNWMPTYDTIFARRDRALVPVVDGVCGGCHMNVPRYVVHDARKQAEMVRCTFCGRLVY